jgi:hypothetical protein
VDQEEEVADVSQEPEGKASRVNKLEEILDNLEITEKRVDVQKSEEQIEGGSRESPNVQLE